MLNSKVGGTLELFKIVFQLNEDGVDINIVFFLEYEKFKSKKTCCISIPLTTFFVVL